MPISTVRFDDSLGRDIASLAKAFGVSKNHLMVMALEKFVADNRRDAIDKEFEGMARDEAYQTLTAELLNEFAYSDAEVGERNGGKDVGK